MVWTLQIVRLSRSIPFSSLHVVTRKLMTHPSLAPKYEELAAMYADDATYAKKVTIAKVDATANDVPDEIQGFPTIKLFPAGGKAEPIEYSGARTIEDLAAFVKEKGKYQVDVYANVTDEDEDEVMPDADSMGKAAPAATDKVKSKVSEVVDAAKTALKDSDGDRADHDEL